MTFASPHRSRFPRLRLGGEECERLIAGVMLAAFVTGQITALNGQAPRPQPSLCGVRRAASQLSRKLTKGEGRFKRPEVCPSRLVSAQYPSAAAGHAGSAPSIFWRIFR